MDADADVQAPRRRRRLIARSVAMFALRAAASAVNFLAVPAFEICCMRRMVGGLPDASPLRPLAAIRVALAEHWSLSSLIWFQVTF